MVWSTGWRPETCSAFPPAVSSRHCPGALCSSREWEVRLADIPGTAEIRTVHREKKSLSSFWYSMCQQTFPTIDEQESGASRMRPPCREHRMCHARPSLPITASVSPKEIDVHFPFSHFSSWPLSGAGSDDASERRKYERARQPDGRLFGRRLRLSRCALAALKPRRASCMLRSVD